MGRITSYRDLIVWQKSIYLVKQIYILTEQLPREEQFGIISQMRRAAVSIPSNIAEGHERNNRKEYAHFLGIAKGSAAELETQLIITGDIFDVATEALLEDLLEIRKMLFVLTRKLQS